MSAVVIFVRGSRSSSREEKTYNYDFRFIYSFIISTKRMKKFPFLSNIQSHYDCFVCIFFKYYFLLLPSAHFFCSFSDIFRFCSTINYVKCRNNVIMNEVLCSAFLGIHYFIISGFFHSFSAIFLFLYNLRQQSNSQ